MNTALCLSLNMDRSYSLIANEALRTFCGGNSFDVGELESGLVLDQMEKKGGGGWEECVCALSDTYINAHTKHTYKR